MAKINKEEYEVLKSLDDEWKWIARDELLLLFTNKPYKTDEWGMNIISNIDTYEELQESVTDDILFQFIQWENDEPYNIQELIEEFESSLIKSTPWTPNPLDFNESEETEVKKDKKWLVDKWTKEQNETDVYDPMYQFISEFIADVNQLDEPEVLSSDWIKDNQLMWPSAHGVDYHVPANKLYGKLVPKQEITFEQAYDKLREESILSQKSFDYYWNCISDDVEIDELKNTLVPKQEKVKISEQWHDIDNLNVNDVDGFARAWLAYPDIEVEKEPLYRARLKVITDEFIASYLRTQSSDAEDRLKALEIGSKYIHEDYRHLSEFTEDELKRLDIWDSEQWEIEELEE